MSSGTRWLELFMTHYADKFRDKLDVLVAFVHWCYIDEGFQCLGSPPPDLEITPTRVAALLRDSEGGSELLPLGWNSSDEGTWSLAYKLPAVCPCSSSSSSPTVVLLKAVKIDDDDLTINVVKPESEDVSSLSLSPNVWVADDHRNLKGKQLLKEDATSLRNRVVEEIIRPFFTPPSPPASTAENVPSPSSNPQSGIPPPDQRSDLYIRPRADDPLRDLGRSDLDPFSGATGGGMIFDPARGGRGGNVTPFGPDGRPLPHGSVPPGARFDPFTPFGPGGVPDRGRGRGRGRGGFGPDPDHERPPGWDDMFM